MRARNIKPDFFKNDKLAEVPMTARLLFIGLWCYADRDGFFEVRPKKIKAEIFPYENLKTEHIIQALSALVTSGFILNFNNPDSDDIMQIVNFKSHQRPHYNEKPSVLKDIIKTCNQSNNNLLPKKQALVPDIRNDDIIIDDCGMRNDGKAPSCVPFDLSGLWLDMTKGVLPGIAAITDKRKTSIKARLKETPKQIDPKEYWQNIIQRILDSDFCCGKSKNGWKASFDWLLQPDTHIKVLEGKYDNKKSGGLNKTQENILASMEN